MLAVTVTSSAVTRFILPKLQGASIATYFTLNKVAIPPVERPDLSL
jgi:hypothetical protein